MHAARFACCLLGGLTLFIFGMKLMGDGIQKVAGENMKKILQFFARNGIVAVLAGTLVTAVIQSSSATTVMVSRSKPIIRSSVVGPTAMRQMPTSRQGDSTSHPK